MLRDQQVSFKASDAWCASFATDLGNYVRQFASFMTQMTEEARRAGVYPGAMRDARRKHRLDWSWLGPVGATHASPDREALAMAGDACIAPTVIAQIDDPAFGGTCQPVVDRRVDSVTDRGCRVNHIDALRIQLA